MGKRAGVRSRPIFFLGYDMFIELSATQARLYAVPLIRETMGEEIGNTAESEFSNAETECSGLYGHFDDSGLCAVCGIGSELSRRKVWLGYLAVRKDKRRTGLGSSGLRFIEELAAKLGYRHILVETYDHPTFAVARRLYEKSGYKPVGELADYMDDGSDALYYRKTLGV